MRSWPHLWRSHRPKMRSQWPQIPWKGNPINCQNCFKRGEASWPAIVSPIWKSFAKMIILLLGCLCIRPFWPFVVHFWPKFYRMEGKFNEPMVSALILFGAFQVFGRSLRFGVWFLCELGMTTKNCILQNWNVDFFENDFKTNKCSPNCLTFTLFIWLHFFVCLVAQNKTSAAISTILLLSLIESQISEFWLEFYRFSNLRILLSFMFLNFYCLDSSLAKYWVAHSNTNKCISKYLIAFSFCLTTCVASKELVLEPLNQSRNHWKCINVQTKEFYYFT